MMPGVSEWVIILIIVVLLFGAKKIPELARGVGKGIKEFKGAMKEGEEDSNVEKPKELAASEKQEATAEQSKANENA